MNDLLKIQDVLQIEIVGGALAVMLAIWALWRWLLWQHRRLDRKLDEQDLATHAKLDENQDKTRGKLDRMHREQASGHATLHGRLDAEGKESLHISKGIRTRLASAWNAGMLKFKEHWGKDE